MHEITPAKAHVQRRKMNSPRKQPSFRDASNGFPAKRRLRNEPRNSILMTCYYLDPGSASDIMKQIFRSTTQVWVVMRHLDGNNRWRPKIWAILLG